MGNVDEAAARADLVQRSLPLVQHAVSSISSRIPRYVAWEDLISAGLLGLAEAARSFDPSRGVPFDGYASTRIRGALLDELRSLDWASRSVRTKARALEQGSNELAVTLGRAPTPDEVAVHLGVDRTEVQSIVDDVHRATLVHYDAVGFGGDPEDILPPGGRGPDEVLVERERLSYLRDAVSALPERLRIVVEGYFFEERLMQDIADELGVTESRVSQMRTEALGLLRDGMNAQLDPDLVTEERPGSVVGRRRAAYYAAVAASSDFRGRLDLLEDQRPAAPPATVHPIGIAAS